MALDADLYLADESIDPPDISKRFLEDVIWSYEIDYDAFLTKKERDILRPNPWGEIVLGRRREANFFEKLMLPFVMKKALKGNLTVEEINKKRDKLVIRSEKIEDRERDPVFFKSALNKLSAHLPDQLKKECEKDFIEINSFLEEVIKANKKVLWEY